MKARPRTGRENRVMNAAVDIRPPFFFEERYDTGLKPRQLHGGEEPTMGRGFIVLVVVLVVILLVILAIPFVQ